MAPLLDTFYQSNSLTLKILSLLRYYGVFRKTYRFLKKSQWWSKEELEAYQLGQLQNLLHHAYENVPYYRRVFDERQLKPEDIRSLADLQMLPYLTKDIVQNNREELKARNYPEEAFEYVTSGGTTGNPLGFYYEKGVSRAKEWAFMKTQWDRVGYSFFDKCVILRGNIVKSANDGKYWEKSFFGRWLILSSYHMNNDTIADYAHQIRLFRPKFIQAFPSTIFTIAQYIKDNRIEEKFPTLQAILCGSEKVYPWERELIESVFKCRIYSWYGMSEQVTLAGECEDNAEYHIFSEYGIVELISDTGSQIHQTEEQGEVVATSLTNYCFPFIRYRTKDHAIMATNENCECGRHYSRLKTVVGRDYEYIMTSKGKVILSFASTPSSTFDNVLKFQFIQEKIGEVTMNIVKKSTYTDRDSDTILQTLQRKMGNDVHIDIQFVVDIPKTKNGKYQFFIQNIPLEEKSDGVKS
ncbi:coenzyme F390 synthetase [Methanocalculus chunghsingensis]|uniref:Coenzyme F390 synthetase n=1 Tax=Methanocalculus chunghsingensis TaxID=156457 RepID=A0A8J7W8T8_9EURY|nr:phenylacetate--CoA ligase family protein [Methanocalculus chunghsingensis]MBR1368257.1 coenzyme F390 synthetase [Methanocalculus chunghsingensis]